MKMFLIILFGIFISVLISTLIYLAYNNRASEDLWSKLLPALTVGVVGACLTLWFSLKEEKIDTIVPTILITHIESGRPLFILDPRYLLFGVSKFSILQDKMRPFENQEMADFHTDVLFIEISRLIFTTFQESKDAPGSNLLSSSKYPKALELDRDAYTWSKFIENWKATPELTKMY